LRLKIYWLFIKESLKRLSNFKQPALRKQAPRAFNQDANLLFAFEEKEIKGVSPVGVNQRGEVYIINSPKVYE